MLLVDSGTVHTTLEQFENGCFTLKTHQMFSITPDKSRITGHFAFSYI